MAAAKESKGHKVVVPLIQVKVGERVLHFYKDDLLPDGVNSDEIKHLESLGFVESA